MRVPTRETLGIVGIVGMLKKSSIFKGLRALCKCGNARGTRSPRGNGCSCHNTEEPINVTRQVLKRVRRLPLKRRTLHGARESLYLPAERPKVYTMYFIGRDFQGAARANLARVWRRFCGALKRYLEGLTPATARAVSARLKNFCGRYTYI